MTYSAKTFNPGSFAPTSAPVFYHNIASINPEYLWIVIIAGVFAFIASFAIGANDTANSWASTVGAKALSVRNAAILAGIFEVTGAFALGANVGGTLKSKIIAPKYYCYDNYALVTRMNGMACVVLSSSLWLLGATWFRVPVSTTHAAVGGIVGFAIITRGWDLVIWWETMGKIFISWVTSPVLSALIAYVIQWLVRRLLFTGEPGSIYRKNHLYLPPIAGVFCGLAAVFAVYIGGKGNADIKKLDAWIFAVIWGAVSFGMMAILSLVAWILRKRFNIDLDAFKGVEPRLHNTGKTKDEETLLNNEDNAVQYPEYLPAASTDYSEYPSVPVNSPYPEYPQHAPDFPSAVRPPTGGANYAPVPSAATFFNNENLEGEKDIYDGVTEEEFAAEQLWMPLCWLVASVESFSHGANDVGNAIGPYSGLLDAYNVECPNGTKSVAYWILGLGACGILIGLVTVGHRVIGTLGVNIAIITPQKAAVAECGAVIAVLLATALAIPVSTTHCSVGAIAGMAMHNGGLKNVNWMTIRDVIIAIVVTVPGCALLTASMFGFWQAAVFGASFPGPSAFNQTCNATFPGPW